MEQNGSQLRTTGVDDGQNLRQECCQKKHKEWGGGGVSPCEAGLAGGTGAGGRREGAARVPRGPLGNEPFVLIVAHPPHSFCG